ncbi:MAG: hypothetical protein RI964_810 [Pseudomonadota bacterium]|jgi:hypothetical protein
MQPATDDVIDACVTQLATLIPGLHSERFPANPDSYRLNHPVGAMLVYHPSSRYTPACGGVARRAAVVGVRLYLRNLSSQHVSYDYKDAIVDAINGFCPGEKWTELWVVGDSFVSQESGLWQFDVIFETTSRVISNYGACSNR